MRIAINDVGIDYVLDKIGIVVSDRSRWIKRIRDDFNEEISNNKLVYSLLKQTRHDLQKITEGVFESLDDIYKDDLHDFDLLVRLRVFAHCIDRDVLNYTHYLNLRKSEPNLIERFSHIYIVDDFIIIVFEEFDE